MTKSLKSYIVLVDFSDIFCLRHGVGVFTTKSSLLHTGLLNKKVIQGSNTTTMSGSLVWTSRSRGRLESPKVVLCCPGLSLAGSTTCVLSQIVRSVGRVDGIDVDFVTYTFNYDLTSYFRSV